MYSMKSLPKLNQPFLEGIDRLILKFIWKHEELSIAKTVLKEETNGGGLSLPDF